MKGSDIAFLMPAYNPDPVLLAAAVAPILAQTRPSDLVVVDDGSAQPVAALLPDDPRITVLRLERNAGLVGALNAGLAHIVGAGYRYIARIDADDLVRRERAALQAARLDADPALDLVGSVSPAVDPQGRTLFVRGAEGGPEAMALRLRWNPPFSHSSFFFRSSVVERFGDYDPDFYAAEDYEFLCRIVARGGRIACLGEPLVTYLVNPDGISSRQRTRQLAMRLKTQLRYFDPLSPAAYVGVAGSMLTRALPQGAMEAAKRALGRGL